MKHLMHAIYHSGRQDKMDGATAIIDDMFEWMETHDRDAYNRFKDKAEDVKYSYSIEDAQDVVRNMSPTGEMWSYDDVKSYLNGKGGDCKEYYLVMNMAYNDYRRTAQNNGLDNPDFYYSLAYDFINDPDAKKHKVEKYFGL